MPVDVASPDPEAKAGKPDLHSANKHMNQLLKTRHAANEDDVKYSVRAVLESLFPNYIVSGERYVGQGRADLICSNIVVETKNPGSNPRSLSSPRGRKNAERQATKYLDSLSPQQKLFRNSPWRCLVTNGLVWLFYQYDMPKRQKQAGALRLEEKFELANPADVDRIVQYLLTFVDSTAPPPLHRLEQGG